MRFYNSALFFAGLSAAYNGHQTKPTATIDGGVIVGTWTSLPSAPAAVNKFLGVPFAAPPKRFEPPQNHKPWTRPLDTRTRKPACVQEFAFAQPVLNLTLALFNTPPPEESEDCLYLNVWAPAKPAPKGGRAVMFWIYGGGLYFGDASIAQYDGSHFAAYEDVVIVAANYRTNVFGFPDAPELDIKERNLGFLDQRLALDWVQRNIHAFGGNPNKVTIFGESAGSFSVDALLTSFPAKSTPPFRAAIMESGQLSYRGSPNVGKPYPDGKLSWDALAAALNCTDAQSNLTCISAAPASTIKEIIESEFLFFFPVFDNQTFFSNSAERRKAGDIARIPILSGTNADEGRFIVYSQNNLTAYLQQALGAAPTPDLVAAVERQYPIGSERYPTTYDALADIDTDISFQCGAALVANDTAAVGIPSWRYYYNASFPNTARFPDSRAYHSSEIESVFSTYPVANSTAAQRELSGFMRGAWAKFAKDPAAGPGWKAIDVNKKGAADVAVFTAEQPKKVKLVTQSEVDGRCAFWRDILAGRY
ncbi:carboxylesterase [Karstenula rhodostoma CBS 690.94]|uniref:Carboxylic ester hydrolase n=1 Tax=Karstenula rhodostoma CBS 690.94 TaxID=1392251 RepID=A0A9P4PWW7_9PLEO|nr:carboxylesterase [Karstenula rhodostoma CBS 690.94]